MEKIDLVYLIIIIFVSILLIVFLIYYYLNNRYINRIKKRFNKYTISK